MTRGPTWPGGISASVPAWMNGVTPPSWSSAVPYPVSWSQLLIAAPVPRSPAPARRSPAPDARASRPAPRALRSQPDTPAAGPPADPGQPTAVDPARLNDPRPVVLIIPRTAAPPPQRGPTAPPLAVARTGDGARRRSGG